MGKFKVLVDEEKPLIQQLVPIGPSVVEKVVIKEVPVEVLKTEIIEKIVEVPVEKIVTVEKEVVKEVIKEIMTSDPKTQLEIEQLKEHVKSLEQYYNAKLDEHYDLSVKSSEKLEQTLNKSLATREIEMRKAIRASENKQLRLNVTLYIISGIIGLLTLLFLK